MKQKNVLILHHDTLPAFIKPTLEDILGKSFVIHMANTILQAEEQHRSTPLDVVLYGSHTFDREKLITVFGVSRLIFFTSLDMKDPRVLETLRTGISVVPINPYHPEQIQKEILHKCDIRKRR